MIISHKHKFIFIKTYKTASTSIEIALASICGSEDIITNIQKEDEELGKKYGYRGAQNIYEGFNKYSIKDIFKFLLKNGKKKYKFAPHNDAKYIKGRVSKEVWDTYYKFCFDRNPWDKAVSSYFYQNGEKKWGSFEWFIKSGDLFYTKGFDLYSINGVVAVDKVYKFEELKESLQDISKKLNLKQPISLPEKKANSRTRSDKRHYSEILSDEESRMIKTMYAREIDLLNYKY